MNKCETRGQRMVKRREELRLSQADVAAKVRLLNGDGGELQLSANAYATYERDEIDAKVGTIEAIAAALCVAPAWLAFGTGAPAPGKVGTAEMIH